jgi:hypothetical protein
MLSAGLSKDEIKNAFTAELKTTIEYQIILNIKQRILNDIATPNIQRTVHYDFDRVMNQDEQANIKMCGIIEFGFEIYVNEYFAEVYMDKFLE